MAGFNYRGAWTPTTAYAVDDAYTEAGSTYAVTTAYASGTTFSSTDTSNSSIIAQAGAQGPAGPAGTVTATGSSGNFDVPGLLTNEGGYLSVATRTTPSGAQDAIIETDQFSSYPTFTGSGHSFGGEWTVQKTIHLEPTILQRGIGQVIGFAEKKYAVGDHAGIYGYVRAVAGRTAQSDEGISGATLEVIELNDLLKAHLTQQASTGSTTPPLTRDSGMPVDGGFLLNVSQGATAGTLNGDSLPLANTFLNYLPVTGVTLPQTTAWAIANAAIPIRNCSADSPVLTTVDVTLQPITSGGVTTYPQFAANDIVSVAGNWYPEQALVHSVSTVDPAAPQAQTLELYLRNPNQKAVIFKGGIAGSYISFDANYQFSNVRSSYYAFGSLHGDDLIYGVNVTGNLEGNFLPRPTLEAARSTGTSAGFHLFPGAEVVKGPSSTATLDITLEANTVQWNAADQVECTAGPYFSGTGLSLLWQSDSPSSDAVGVSIVAKGKNISDGYQHQRWINDNPFENYLPFGGPLFAPNMNVISGPWQDWFHGYYPPLGSLFKFLNFADPNQNSYSIFAFPKVGAEFNYLRDANRYSADAFQTGDLLVNGPILAATLKVNYGAEFGQSGVILADSVTNARMRVQVTNGALVVTAA